MSISTQLPPRMGAPPALKPLSRHFLQWSKTSVLAISSGSEDDVVNEVKKSPPEQSGSGFVISGSDATARVAHLEHSVRFLQEQHRLMLSGLHAEIEALRERNRDLQFQLIFNKESSPKTSPPASEDATENNEESNLKREVSRLEREAAAARGEARAAEARALQLQRLVDAQAEKLRELELARSVVGQGSSSACDDAEETRGELRARLADAERLVRRLRADAERQRRELQCMKNSLHASLRASGLDGYGYHNNYHFPPVQDFWREPLREEFSVGGAGGGGGGCAAVGGARGAARARRPITLPELAGQQIHRSTVYANNHTRPRANGFDPKGKKVQAPNGDAVTMKTPDEPTVTGDHRLKLHTLNDMRSPERMDSKSTYPELKVVVARMIPHGNVSSMQPLDGGSRPRARRQHHRKHATDHT